MKQISATERQSVKSLVQGVVLAQGNIFIRELLRRKDLRIGTKKEDFESHLLEAIDSGKLRLADVTAWLEEVEGWGDQHVYLFEVRRSLAEDPIWKSPARLKRKLPDNQRALWGTRSYNFPEEWGLTGIALEDDALSYVWHRHRAHLLRRPTMDRREEIDGDWYQLKAHLERVDRAAMRFVLRLDRRLAAVFMQIPVEGKAHADAMARVKQATTPLVDWASLTPFSVSDAIKRLDQSALTGSILRPDFQWVDLIRRGQVLAVLCHYAPRDFWARVAHYVIPDAGPSGRIGFNDRQYVVHRELQGGRHSDFFAPGRLKELFEAEWQPFLVTPAAAASHDSSPSQSWKEAPWPFRAHLWR